MKANLGISRFVILVIVEIPLNGLTANGSVTNSVIKVVGNKFSPLPAPDPSPKALRTLCPTFSFFIVALISSAFASIFSSPEFLAFLIEFSNSKFLAASSSNSFKSFSYFSTLFLRSFTVASNAALCSKVEVTSA